MVSVPDQEQQGHHRHNHMACRTPWTRRHRWESGASDSEWKGATLNKSLLFCGLGVLVLSEGVGRGQMTLLKSLPALMCASTEL